MQARAMPQLARRGQPGAGGRAVQAPPPRAMVPAGAALPQAGDEEDDDLEDELFEKVGGWVRVGGGPFPLPAAWPVHCKGSLATELSRHPAQRAASPPGRPRPSVTRAWPRQPHAPAPPPPNLHRSWRPWPSTAATMRTRSRLPRCSGAWRRSGARRRRRVGCARRRVGKEGLAAPCTASMPSARCTLHCQHLRVTLHRATLG